MANFTTLNIGGILLVIKNDRICSPGEAGFGIQSLYLSSS
jgi:hypothetical protein